MNVQLLSVPYDSGRRSFRLGRGPEHLIQQGLLGRLRDRGHRVEHHEIVIPDPPVPSDIGSAIAIDRQLAERVQRAVAAEMFPLILAGNCNTAVGTLAGIGPERSAVLWFDSHADLNTPETTTSGFLDGMALAMVVGRCWTGIAQTVVGWQPVAAERVALIAARDLDPPEEAFLKTSAMGHVRAEALRTRGVASTLAPMLDGLARSARVFYLHLDLDVVDPIEASVNQYQAPNGPDTSTLTEAVRLIAQRRPIGAAAITAYDPAIDIDGRASNVAMILIERLLAAVEEAAVR